MQAITVAGLDIAKSVFQVYGGDAQGSIVVRQKLKRRYVVAFFKTLPPCLVGIEACATSHHWSRELQGVGHTVRLIPPAYAKPYVKRQSRGGLRLLTVRPPRRRSTAGFVTTRSDLRSASDFGHGGFCLSPLVRLIKFGFNDAAACRDRNLMPWSHTSRGLARRSASPN